MSRTFEHDLSYSLDIFKFNMIVDDSFYRLKEQMIVHDSFSASGLVKDRLKPRSNLKWLPRCCQLETNRVTILTKVITRRTHVCGTFFAMITTIGMLLEKQRRTTGKLESKKHCIKFTFGYVLVICPFEVFFNSYCNL